MNHIDPFLLDRANSIEFKSRWQRFKKWLSDLWEDIMYWLTGERTSY
jgi:hypothetical protein